MARSAVLAGRTGSDVVYNSISILLMSITGLLVGWRIRTPVLEAIGGFLLLLLFSYALSWIMAYVGLKVGTVEIVNNVSFMFIMPLTFIANTFVWTDRLPGPLQTFAEWNPCRRSPKRPRTRSATRVRCLLPKSGRCSTRWPTRSSAWR